MIAGFFIFGQTKDQETINTEEEKAIEQLIPKYKSYQTIEEEDKDVDSDEDDNKS